VPHTENLCCSGGCGILKKILVLQLHPPELQFPVFNRNIRQTTNRDKAKAGSQKEQLGGTSGNNVCMFSMSLQFSLLMIISTFKNIFYITQRQKKKMKQALGSNLAAPA